MRRSVALLPCAVAGLCDLQTCGPLKVSESGHYLTYQDGSPFYYVADTPWHLFQDLNYNDGIKYIEARAAQGFTALQLGALPLSDTPNSNGDRFGRFDDINEPYWNFTDTMLLEMQKRGMAAYLIPIWAFNWAGGGGGGGGATEQEHYEFGVTLGRRWKGYKNILWGLGGDFFPRPEPVEKYRQLLAGIRDGGATQLSTCHVASGHSSSEIMPNDLDFFSIQNRAGRSWLNDDGMPNISKPLTSSDNQWTGYLTLQDFNHMFNGRHKPTLMVEPWYEVGHSSQDACTLHKVRGVELRESYWGNRVCGSLGEGYGAWGAWLSLNKGAASICGKSTTGWERDIELPGAIDIATHMQRILKELPWWHLQPDGDQAVQGGGGLYVARLAENSGGYAVLVYTTAQKTFDVKTLQFLGQADVDVRYFDPAGGDQSGSDAFPVSHITLSGATVTVPEHSWTGDAVIIIQPSKSDLIVA